MSVQEGAICQYCGGQHQPCWQKAKQVFAEDYSEQFRFGRYCKKMQWLRVIIILKSEQHINQEIGLRRAAVR